MNIMRRKRRRRKRSDSDEHKLTQESITNLILNSDSEFQDIFKGWFQDQRCFSKVVHLNYRN